MDFAELEKKEGVRLSWNAWPSSRIEATRVVLPFGAVCTPCKPMPEMPVLPYAPVVCTECSAVLNPYCMVDYHQKRWQCCLCNTGNALPRNYHGACHIRTSSRPRGAAAAREITDRTVARASPSAAARRVRRPNALPGVTRSRARGRHPRFPLDRRLPSRSRPLTLTPTRISSSLSRTPFAPG
jgi:hypothetical protein